MNISENEVHSAIYCSENEYFARRCRHYKAKESKAEPLSLGQGFTWLDTGTHESLVDATNFVKTVEQHQHRKIACLEEIAYLNGWISKDELMEVYEVMKKNQYGQYLKDVMDGKYQEHLY